MNTKSTSETGCTSDSGSWLAPMAWGVGAGLAAGMATALFALFKMPLPLRAAMVVVPVALSLGYIKCVVGIYRGADELQRRIQLESLGFAFPATAILVMADDLLEKAGILPTVHWGSGLEVAAMCLLWLAGYGIAVRRYR